MKFANEIKELISYREMLRSLIKKDLRSRYRGSVLGFLWTLLNPLFQLLIYSVVFPHLLKVSEKNYPLFVFVGLLPWIFFTSAVSVATTSIVSNSNLIKKIYFPRLVIPFSVSAVSLINMLFGFIIAFAAIIITKTPVGLSLTALPAVILIQFLFVTGLCCIFSSLYVYFRDFEHIVSVLLTAWFYLTPVVYSEDLLSGKVKLISSLNPMTRIIYCYRQILLYNSLPQFSSIAVSAAYAIAVFIMGISLFSILQRRFAEEI